MSEHNPAEVAAVKAATLAPMSIKDTVLAQFKEAETTLVELAERYRNVAYDVATTKGMKEAVAARADLRDNGRLFVTKAETRIKGEVNDLKRVMAEEVTRLVAIVKPVEDAVDEQIKAEERRKEAEKAEKARIEAERVAAHRAKIDKLASYAERAKGQPLEALEKAAATLEAYPIGPEYEEFQAEATQTRDKTVQAIKDLAQAERLRLENERMAAELAKLRAQQAEAEAKAEAERLERERAHAAQVEAERIAREQAEAASPALIREELIEAEDSPNPFAEISKEDSAAADKMLDELRSKLQTATPVLSDKADADRSAIEFIERIESKADTGATMKLGEINAALSPIQISADGLAQLGIQSVGKERSAVLYRASDMSRICAALVQHIHSVSTHAALAA